MATGFTGLDNTVPADTAFIGDGASEIRAVKDALITVFPDVNGAITKPLEYGPGPDSTSPTEASFSQLFTDVESLVNPQTSNSPVIPQGMITMWSGDATDPAAITALNAKGWFLCTGTTAPNGYTIPDLQDKFVKGWGAQPVAAGGGGGDSRTGKAVVTGTSTDKTLAKTVELTDANLPQHSHFTVVNQNLESDDVIDGSNSMRVEFTPNGVDGGYLLRAATSGTPNISKTSTYGNPSPTAIDVGADATTFAHEHLLAEYEPAYYVVAYIIYAGVV